MVTRVWINKIRGRRPGGAKPQRGGGSTGIEASPLAGPRAEPGRKNEGSAGCIEGQDEEEPTSIPEAGQKGAKASKSQS